MIAFNHFFDWLTYLDIPNINENAVLFAEYIKLRDNWLEFFWNQTHIGS